MLLKQCKYFDNEMKQSSDLLIENLYILNKLALKLKLLFSVVDLLVLLIITLHCHQQYMNLFSFFFFANKKYLS